jgi:acyl-CoA thioester hydrolase
VLDLPPFRYRLRVRYAECDAQKVVFNARYGDYVDLAVLEFFRALGLYDIMVTGPLDCQVVKQTLEWKASARFDQMVEVAVRAMRLGNTSFTLGSVFRIVGDNTIVATVETVYVLVDAKTLAKMSIPADIRAALERGAPGVVTDHSGRSGD